MTLTATDSKGVTASKTVTIVPQTIGLTIASVPPGAPITYAGYPQVAGAVQRQGCSRVPHDRRCRGALLLHGRTYVFDSWSDGGAISHDVSIPANDLVLTARYRDTGPAPFSGTSAGLAPGGDKLGPVVRLRSRRPARKLAGTVSDPAGVSSLRIAVRRGCRWWNASTGRLGRTAKCAQPRWMNAVLRPSKPGTWAGG